MQKAKKSFMDSRARKHLTSLNTELQDVQRIMVQNIDDVLQRGVALSGKLNMRNNVFFFMFKTLKCLRPMQLLI